MRPLLERRGRRLAEAREPSAVRLRRIGGGQHEHVLLVSRPVGAQLAQPLDGPWERELRAAEPLHEVPAPADSERLQGSKLCVHGAVAALHSFPTNAVARDDALPLEQELRQRRRSGASGKSDRASAHLPCVGEAAVARERMKRRLPRSGRGAS